MGDFTGENSYEPSDEYGDNEEWDMIWTYYVSNVNENGEEEIFATDTDLIEVNKPQIRVNGKTLVDLIFMLKDNDTFEASFFYKKEPWKASYNPNVGYRIDLDYERLEETGREVSFETWALEEGNIPEEYRENRTKIADNILYGILDSLFEEEEFNEAYEFYMSQSTRKIMHNIEKEQTEAILKDGKRHPLTDFL